MRTGAAYPTHRQLWTLGLFLLATGGLPPAEADARAARFVRVKVDVANLRAEPSRRAALVRRAYANEPLLVVGGRADWLQVHDFAGESAWIDAGLTDGRPAVVVVRDLVNVRREPGTGSPVAFTAERGVSLLVRGRSGRWLRVRHDVGEGWVHDSLVWGPP
jgi:SH3-like domain-containing protein